MKIRFINAVCILALILASACKSNNTSQLKEKNDDNGKEKYRKRSGSLSETNDSGWCRGRRKGELARSWSYGTESY